MGYFSESDGRPTRCSQRVSHLFLLLLLLLFFFLTKFCAGDFSKTIQWFFMKLSQNMRHYMKLLHPKSNLENSLLVPSYGQFPDFKMRFCRALLSKKTEDMNWRLIADDSSWFSGLQNHLFVRRQYFRSLRNANLKNHIF